MAATAQSERKTLQITADLQTYKLASLRLPPLQRADMLAAARTAGSQQIAGHLMMDHLTDCIPQVGQDAENATGSAVRARLAAAIAELAAAEAELAAAQEPATRLAAIIAEATRLDADVAALKAAEEHELGAWLAAGGSGSRPERNPAMIGAEQRHADLTGDAAAARAALPAAEAAFQRCALKVAAAQRRRDEALCVAAAEAARDFARGYRAALIAALDLEAALHGLRAELLRCGNRPNVLPGALEAAARVGEVIAETKRSASVRHDPGVARRLLAALVTDPEARLQLDGEP